MHCRPSQQSLLMFRKRPSFAASGISSQRLLFSPVSSIATNANGAAGGDPVSPALIQRFIILHDGLMPVCPSKKQPRLQHRRNPQLSEDASLEEHGEFILYYYDHSLHFLQPSDNIVSDASVHSARREKLPADHATEEAIRFAGICRALRSLPLALQPEKQCNESEENSSAPEEDLSETDVVHLKDSSLVFVPLEMGGNVFAIAQIPRADRPQMAFSKSGHTQSQCEPMGFGADPSAIQGAIRHTHATFSLLFGGGIHRQLLRTKNKESSKDWVLEVIDDDEDESSSLKSSVLQVKDDTVWEITNEGQAEPIEQGFSSKNGSRRKPNARRTSFKKLSLSVTSINTVDSDSNQMKRYYRHKDFSGDYIYGGMDELFKLRREHRKLSNELKESRPTGRFGGLAKSSRRWESHSNAEDLFNDIANDFGHDDCERRIENLLKVLPITELRKDLVKFYDEWLCRMHGVCETMQGGVGRCMVEMVPSPVSFRSARDPVRGQHPPLSPTAFVCLAAGEFMKSLVHEEVPKLKEFQGRLLGMSLFYQNRLVLSEAFPLHGSKDGHAARSFPPEIPYTIAEYFHSSHERKLKFETATEHVASERNVVQDANGGSPLTEWMSGLSIGAAKNDSLANNGKSSSSSEGNDKKAGNGDASVGYVAYPTSSSDSDGPVESLFVRNFNTHVWLPRVYLPFSPSFDGIGHDDETEHYAALFESHELSFLLIFELPSPGEETSVLAQMAEELKPKSRRVDKGSSKHISNETQAFTNMLIFVADQLTEFCNTYSSHEVDTVSDDIAPIKEINSNCLFPGEAGMDIICIDRDENSFVLMSKHDLSSNEFKRIVPNTGATMSTNGSKPKFGLFGMGSKPKESSDGKDPCHPLQYTNMLDCRHKLAAYLPQNIMLAFDDMFNEMGRLSCRRNELTLSAGKSDKHDNNDMCTNKSIELCTFLPQGWVYGRAFGNVELYILLDTSKFVTINDVQKAVTRVRERIFNDKIR